jgi:Gas vesicle synthesis protein GvpL/GvpF
MYYLYGVVRADRPDLDAKGVGAPPGDVVLVRSGPLAVAATELPDDFVLKDEDARTHLKVLIALLSDGPVLPLRMGTVAPDVAAVRTDVLGTAPQELIARLDALDGLVELHVDADDDETEAIAAVAQSAGIAPISTGDITERIELGREIAELLVERRQQIATEIVEELRPFALRDAPRAVLQGPEDPVLRWAFLVKRDDIDKFDEAIVATRSHHSKTAIRYIGPLPPSHFIDWQPDAETEQPDSFTASTSWGW